MDKEKIQKILNLEKQKGYSNDAVFGGLEEFVRNNTSCEEMHREIEGYADKSRWERKECLSEILNLLHSAQTDSEELAEGDLEDPVEKAKGVGEKRGQLLRKLGLETVEDLLFYLPRDLEDRRNQKNISELKSEQKATVVGRVEKIDTLKRGPEIDLVKVGIEDGTGIVYAIWFNQPWMQQQFKKGEKIACYGKVTKNYGELQIENPVWEPAPEKEKTRRLVPQYTATEGLSQSTLRWVINANLNRYSPLIEDYASDPVLSAHQMLGREESLKKIHRPQHKSDVEKGRRSLSFHELFLFYYGLIQFDQLNSDKGIRMRTDEIDLSRFYNQLPFELTEDQRQSIEEVKNDLAAPSPMNRLLQGDVGSGKTAVAATAVFVSSSCGYQSALMVPTTILAKQHYSTLQESLNFDQLKSSILTSDTDPEERRQIVQELKEGQLDLLVGTHSLLNEEIEFKELGLVIIDEEQRFGVRQQGVLKEREPEPNTLVMSATPIPRTIANTVYGDYDISRLEEMPHGGNNVETYWISESRRKEVYDHIRTKLSEGMQAYVVFPLVEESEETDLNAAVESAERLGGDWLKEFNTGLLHGRMTDREKEKVLKKFKEGELEVLIATTVIEVGIDVPDVNILVIEHADRFGLAQLHQLRGRIGRSGETAYCFALASPGTEKGRKRLSVFRDTDDGFEIVEEDLRLRGPGDLLGHKQHGFENSFRACDLIEDLDIMKIARREANKCSQEEKPQVNRDRLKKEFKRKFGDQFQWIKY